MSMADAVEIAGVGIHAFGRFGDTSVVELGVAAVRAALRDADVGPGGFRPRSAAPSTAVSLRGTRS